MKRNKVIRYILLAFVFGGIIFAGAGWLIFSGNSPLNKSSALSTTYKWARLKPIPDSAVNVSVEARGSMFTREFRISFSAPKEDVASWLQASPGTMEAVAGIRQDGMTVFEIKPGGEAQFSEVIVSADGTEVLIRTYWS